MRAMVMEHQREALVLQDLPRPECGPQQVLIRVIACAVCRARDSAGSSRLARIAMIAMTTRSSMSVKHTRASIAVALRLSAGAPQGEGWIAMAGTATNNSINVKVFFNH